MKINLGDYIRVRPRIIFILCCACIEKLSILLSGFDLFTSSSRAIKVKKQVSLVFSSLHKLWSFANATHLLFMEINTKDKILTSELTIEEIKIAREEFNAEIVTPLQNNPDKKY